MPATSSGIFRLIRFYISCMGIADVNGAGSPPFFVFAVNFLFAFSDLWRSGFLISSVSLSGSLVFQDALLAGIALKTPDAGGEHLYVAALLKMNGDVGKILKTRIDATRPRI